MKDRFWQAFIIIGFALGHGYLFLSHKQIESEVSLSFCPIKSATGWPCPSCGSTRAALELYTGAPLKSLMINPLGTISMAAIWFLFILALCDLVAGKYQLNRMIENFEKWASQPLVWRWLMAVILLNWIWNVTKGL